MSMHGPGLTGRHARQPYLLCLPKPSRRLGTTVCGLRGYRGAKNTCSKNGRTNSAEASWLLGRVRVLFSALAGGAAHGAGLSGPLAASVLLREGADIGLVLSGPVRRVISGEAPLDPTAVAA